LHSGGAAPEVLIYKSPGCHPGDVRKLKHMRTPELEALLRGVDACRMHAVFFSTQGERADADKIAGCDHDGDKFTIISDPVLVSLFAEAPPWDAPQSGLINAVKPSEDPNALQCQLISQVLNARYKSSPLVGQSALSLMALSDEAGLGDKRVQEVIEVYYAALDVGITGEILTLKRSLCPREWPEWMRGRSKRTDIKYRESPPSSILGCLHRSLKQVLAEASTRQSAPVDCDPMLLLPGYNRFVKKWEEKRKQYGQEMCLLGEGSEEQRKQRITLLQSKYRSVLLEEYDGEGCLFGPVVNPPDRLLLEVSAIYYVTYQAAQRRQALTPPVGTTATKGTGLSFVWAVAGDFLERIKCCAIQSELCERRGGHTAPTAPKMYMARSMRLLLSGR